MKQRAIVSVINDLVTDQRVSRTCNTLQNMGFDVLLVGRKLPESHPINRNYKTKRFRLLFRKKAVFYAEYNLRLFFYLLFKKADLLISNDIDTALANKWINFIKKTPFIIDCHEYFSEVPELIGRVRVQRFWKRIERKTLPKANFVITVNHSLAKIFKTEFNIDAKVVRNVPYKSKNDDGYIPIKNTKYIIYQGAINVDRGIEEMIQAMEFVPNYTFVIAGDGDILDDLKKNVEQLSWKNRIIFLGKLQPDELKGYTRNAELGVSLEQATCLNYKYCLPNKLFDYIQAGVPVLASDLVEVKKIVLQYNVGEILVSHQPKQMAKQINDMLSNKEQLAVYKANTKKAADELCWENESKVLEEIFLQYLKK